jgi:hypothetical protein
MSDFAGFWSYVHEDDRNSGGRILSLADRLTEAFDLLSVEPLRLFVDRELEWGEEWEKRIQKNLEETTFFIPVVTPRYFRSEPCRKELLDFSRAARDFGVEQLVLPIYYVPVGELEEESPTDEAMALIKSRQWVDLRHVRLLDETDSEHRTVVNGLAERLLQIAQDIEDRPPSSEGGSSLVGPSGDSSPSGGGAVEARDGAEDEDGFLELLAKGEEAIPRWGETIEAIAKVLDRIGTLTQKQAEAMKGAGAESFAARLTIANRFAIELDGPADELVTLGSDYVSHVLQVDPAIRTLIATAESEDEVTSEEDVDEYFGGIVQMVDASETATGQLADFSKVLEEPAKFSRELRRPVRKMQGALRNIIDAQSVLNEWRERIEALRKVD